MALQRGGVIEPEIVYRPWKPKPRRAHGTGSLYPVLGSGGRETWYGRWYVGKKRVQWRIGAQASARHWDRPKSRHSSRSVPMPPQVAAALQRHLDRSQYRDREHLVFGHPRTGKVLSASAIDRRFKKVLRAAKVREVRFEDLRHTFGTRLAANGVPPRDMQEWMGHEDIRTRQIYAAYEPREHEVEAVNEAFSEVRLGP